MKKCTFQKGLKRAFDFVNEVDNIEKYDIMNAYNEKRVRREKKFIFT